MNCDEDPSILKAKKTMRKVLQPLNEHNAKIRADLDSKLNARRHGEEWAPEYSKIDGQHVKRSPKPEVKRNDRDGHPRTIKKSLKETGMDSNAEIEPAEEMA